MYRLRRDLKEAYSKHNRKIQTPSPLVIHLTNVYRLQSFSSFTKEILHADNWHLWATQSPYKRYVFPMDCTEIGETDCKLAVQRGV